MTPGVDNPVQVAKTPASSESTFPILAILLIQVWLWCFVQAIWQSRSRLNSACTVSESSEGCGTAVELEMCEEFSLAGSLKRRRHREDSAYKSQRDSMSGGPPETPSPEMEEEDQNGYVLPGDSPERGDSIIHIFCLLKLHCQFTWPWFCSVVSQLPFYGMNTKLPG